MIYKVLSALTLIAGLAGKGQNFLTKVLPFFCSQVHITSQQSAGLQVAVGESCKGIQTEQERHYNQVINLLINFLGKDMLDKILYRYKLRMVQQFAHFSQHFVT